MDERQLQGEIAGLYQRPLADFITARKQLEARLRDGGDPRSADRVKRLPKPSLSAWTVDQLAGRRRGDLDDLLALGQELRAAQRRALSGGGGSKLQATAAERRRLIDRLLDGARQVLQEAGHPASRSQLDQVEHTLLATATDEALAERVRAGSLDKEAPPPSDFGGLTPMESPTRVAAPRAGARERTKPSPAESRPTEADRRLERARRRADELAHTAEDAESEARRLRQESNAAAQRAAKAKVASERAEARAADARERATRARREAG